MSEYRQQALIEAPVEAVWELVGDPRRHPEWWPKVIEVRGERFDQGDEFAQVTRSPMGRLETTMVVDSRDDLRRLRMHCTKTGTYADWALTEARGSTFVDVAMGMEAAGLSDRLFDRTFGRRYFRSWLADSLDALGRVAPQLGARTD